MNMVRYIVFRLIAGLVLLAAVAGIVFFVYQAGAVHGTTANIQASTAEGIENPYLYHGMPFGYFMWFPALGFLGLIIPLFLLFLAFGAFRRLIWGPRLGWRHMGHGNMAHGQWGEGVPPMFSEWHRRAHAAPADQQPGDKKPDQ
jgi:hypothetical protein